ncbi:5c23351b-bdaf-48e8-9d4d-4cddd20fdec1 [Sclerotinia trifoliorum]|uniref:5c23351b-bdaf-48e8-9d4d-4cddd20fdec1 n=1 Tax=Sclerotinia trifoliorum TaxID=28548 RepID=A0A8H2VT46_9HELO|nr:5c23351b-bdaf-48e8-9d4d-4cddd20fdec1 [Sclerotinia trifoliorum]
MESLKKATGMSAPEHTDEQKKQFYDNLSDEQKQKQTYTEWVKEAYNDQYEKWMPWIEDQYLKWFGKGDNKASYVTKDTLNKTKVTGVSQIDQIQDDVHNLVGNQFGENGLLAPVGNLAGKEGINRMERKGKDEDGSYGGPTSAFTDPVIKNAKGVGQGVVGGAQNVGSGLADGAKTAGGYVGGIFGGGQKEGLKEEQKGN